MDWTKQQTLTQENFASCLELGAELKDEGQTNHDVCLSSNVVVLQCHLKWFIYFLTINLSQL